MTVYCSGRQNLAGLLVSQDEDLLREGARLLKDGEPFSGVIYATNFGSRLGSRMRSTGIVGRILHRPLESTTWSPPTKWRASS